MWENGFVPITDDDVAWFELLLSDLSARLKAWNAPLDALIQEALKKGRPGDGLEAAKRLEAERGKGGKGVPQEIQKAVGDLCEAYLQATPEQRERIRGLLDGKDNLRNHIYNYISASATWIRSSADRRPLERALAAAAIEDSRVDYRDLLMSLGDVWLAAERAGIAPGPAFRDASMLASPVSRGRSGSTQGLLRDFHTSAYLSSIKGGRS